MTEQNVKVSLGELTGKDILVDLIPGLGDFSSGDFKNAMKTVPIGIKAARVAEEKLKALSVSEADYRTWQTSLAARKPGEVEVADIEVAAAMKRVNPDVIEAQIKQKPTMIESRLEERRGEHTELQALHRNLTTVYGSGDFERLDYRLRDDGGKKSIVVEGIEKSWGPNYLRFGLGYASDFSEEQRFNFSVMHRMTWLNSLGAEWRNDVTVGYQGQFHT
jgi:NTE family protein